MGKTTELPSAFTTRTHCNGFFCKRVQTRPSLASGYFSNCLFTNYPYLVSNPVTPETFPLMKRVQYTGNNYEEIKRLCGDKVLAPYFCMGFSMLSVDTGEGFVSVNEGDAVIQEDDGSLSIEKQ